ncbi:MAG: ABC transporter ATP-binding protein, partial [Candidatus Bathyarchaeia archaeon]
MEGVIDLKKVRYSYPGSMGRDALQGIDLSIKEGEYLIVCGASGSGKSTFAYLLNGLIPHFFGGRLEGSVEVKGVRTKEVRVSDLFPRVGIILQNADAQLFNTTVEDEISFGLESLGLSKRDMEKRMEEVVEAFNLGDLLKRSPV